MALNREESAVFDGYKEIK